MFWGIEFFFYNPTHLQLAALFQAIEWLIDLLWVTMATHTKVGKTGRLKSSATSPGPLATPTNII